MLNLVHLKVKNTLKVANLTAYMYRVAQKSKPLPNYQKKLCLTY